MYLPSCPAPTTTTGSCSLWYVATGKNVLDVNMKKRRLAMLAYQPGHPNQTTPSLALQVRQKAGGCNDVSPRSLHHFISDEKSGQS